MSTGKIITEKCPLDLASEDSSVTSSMISEGGD